MPNIAPSATTVIQDHELAFLDRVDEIWRSMLRDTVVIIPAMNEEESIGHVLRDLKRVMPETRFLVVDGNSTDRTREVANLLGAEVISQDVCSEKENCNSGKSCLLVKGKGAALRQALTLDLNVGNVIIMDADRSMRPQEIPMLLTALASGADFVKGSRFLPDGSSEDLSLVRRFGARMFVSLVNLFWSTDYSDLCYGFLALKTKALKRLSLHLRSQNFEIETEICIKAAKLSLKVAEVPSKELKRHDGRSHLYLVRDGFLILKTIMRELLVGHRSLTKGDPVDCIRMNRLQAS